MIKSRYITRTFIQPSQRLRESGIRLKFNPMRHVLEGQRVALVDDSIVRGTTSRRIVDELRRAGAAEVHMRIASPPIMWPCFMGIDIASRNELIAADRSEEEVGRLVGADSLRYLSIAGLRRSMGDPEGRGFCFACFTGDYPVARPPAAGDGQDGHGARGRCRRGIPGPRPSHLRGPRPSGANIANEKVAPPPTRGSSVPGMTVPPQTPSGDSGAWATIGRQAIPGRVTHPDRRVARGFPPRRRRHWVGPARLPVGPRRLPDGPRHRGGAARRAGDPPAPRVGLPPGGRRRLPDGERRGLHRGPASRDPRRRHPAPTCPPPIGGGGC